ncbi:SMP-30/gluconolactonase/LRE family protein [Sandaracinomonas limnophila]|uniref:SMP-30/gluconolactonase/LRE family protein n=1 Tax=Sandaracinomonas limnophila TaxID=1862386 RepID=A0A437PRQ7_9BACT|nr:SMP-30/gluconolactonase/LRE family protein [Sandaracinomonas limnophila]RVU24935.1 SMP-30/gluconolactonase/LRE family protein [Sandaracinomonas limnophila]
MKKIVLIFTGIISSMTAFGQTNYNAIGKIHKYDAELDHLLDTQSKIEVVAEGFVWSEGPVWVKNGNYLLFSDVPSNIIHKWTEKEGLSKFLQPSGYTGQGYYSEETGANGNIINLKGNLVSCEHGDRRISEMPLNDPKGKKTLAHIVDGKKLNSPNDVVQRRNGDYFFTDPPYGLPGRGKPEPEKEIEYQGVYRIDTKGNVSLQAKDMSRPNGLAFNLDESVLIVAQSDPRAIIWNAYPIDKNGNLGTPKIFFDGSELQKQGLRGAGDGMKVDSEGNIWATGPGGILIINSKGKLLGRIETGTATSNVAFGGNDGKTLFITADSYLVRVATKIKGKGL